MWISNRFCTNNVTYDEISQIRSDYAEYETAIELLGNKNKISPNAIRLSKRLKNELDIDVFPSFMITGTKGWTSQGTPQIGRAHV